MKLSIQSRIVPWLILATAVTSCGKQTVDDNLHQEMDRSRESASILTKEYKATEGNYITDADADTSIYWFAMNVKVISVQKEGSLVPQPTLVGAFQTWNKSTLSEQATMNASEGVTVTFNNGTYDPGNNLLAITLSSGGTNTIYVSCNVQNSNTLLCTWIPTTLRGKQFSFVMKRVPRT